MSIGETEFEADVNRADLKSDEMEDITSRLLSAALHVHTTNHLPLGASLVLCLSDDSAGVYDDPGLEIGPIEIKPGVIGASGSVIDSIGSDNTIQLSHDDLQILNNETLYVGQLIMFPGTNGQTVRIESTDYLGVRAHLTVRTRIGDL
jgi:hypothetical protein